MEELNTEKSKNMMGIICSIVLVVSVFLPWAEASSSVSSSLGGGSYSTGGISGISLGYGVFGLLLGVGGLIMSFKRLKWTWLLGLIALVNGISYLIAMGNAGSSSSSSIGGYSASAKMSVDPQVGLFLFLACALLLSVFTLKDRKQA
tara:strand:- start:11 stop:451 length:441 start_codon:yes stop_codon:yes gene_type:complete